MDKGTILKNSHKSHFLLLSLVIIAAAGCAKPALKTPAPAYDSPISTEVVRPGKEALPDSDDSLLAAVTPLARQASDYLSDGQFDKAAATLERALRISPNSAELWSLMAEIQLAEGNWNQAEQLAAKSNLLAGNKPHLKAKNLRIAAEALERKNMPEEAEQALQKARNLEAY